MLYRLHLAWVRFKFTTLVVISTDCICSFKSNYHTTTVTTVPIGKYIFFIIIFYTYEKKVFVFTFWVPYCGVHYDFRIKNMFGSSLPPVVCRKVHVLLTLFVFFLLHIVVSNTYCVVFLFCFSSSCVPYGSSFSGLSIIGCPFSIF